MSARRCACCSREGRDVRVCVVVRGGSDAAGRVHPTRIVLLCPWCAGDRLVEFVGDLPGPQRRAWPKEVT